MASVHLMIALLWIECILQSCASRVGSSAAIFNRPHHQLSSIERSVTNITSSLTCAQLCFDLDNGDQVAPCHAFSYQAGQELCHLSSHLSEESDQLIDHDDAEVFDISARWFGGHAFEVTQVSCAMVGHKDISLEACASLYLSEIPEISLVKRFGYYPAQNQCILQLPAVPFQAVDYDCADKNITLVYSRKHDVTPEPSIWMSAMTITASSVYDEDDNIAVHAFDRNPATYFSTITELNPWIRCDLGQQVQLAGVKFMAREGSYSERTKNLYLNAGLTDSSLEHESSLCSVYPGPPMTSLQVVWFPCDVRPARYVMLTLRVASVALNFNDASIYVYE